MKNLQLAIVVIAGVLVIIMLGGLIAAFFGQSPPAPCVDTITLVSAIPGNPSAARCRLDQAMATENKMQGVVVRCTCRSAK